MVLVVKGIVVGAPPGIWCNGLTASRKITVFPPAHLQAGCQALIVVSI